MNTLQSVHKPQNMPVSPNSVDAVLIHLRKGSSAIDNLKHCQIHLKILYHHSSQIALSEEAGNQFRLLIHLSAQ